MSYSDAFATGRFKQVDGQWAFYPWGHRCGYLLPAREDYWRLHAWTARVVRLWIWLTVALWMLLGPMSVPIVAVLVLAWYRRRAGMAVAGLVPTAVRLTVRESYRARAEEHSLRSLLVSATLSALGTTIALRTAAVQPELLPGAWQGSGSQPFVPPPSTWRVRSCEVPADPIRRTLSRPSPKMPADASITMGTKTTTVTKNDCSGGITSRTSRASRSSRMSRS
jgi:hypothetical protein